VEHIAETAPALSQLTDALNKLPVLSQLTDGLSKLVASTTSGGVVADWALLPVLGATFIAVILGWGQDDDKVGSPYPPGSTTYSQPVADAFFGSRPLYVFRRLMRLGRITGMFNIKLLLDWRFKRLEENEKERAKEALRLATQLGPTFIKLGQALSLRTDLIPEAYALELRQLQDAVPPFDSEEAYDIIARELKLPHGSLTSGRGGGPIRRISAAPVASASIGQVYKATLQDGREVAIKVQRPNILREISLDLFLLRLLTPLQVKVSNAVNKRSTSQGDIDVSLTLVDEWGRGFVNEVDYLAEARNTEVFLQAMEDRGLSAVTAPKVVHELSTSTVLVTEWVEGTRLDLDASSDVPRLCSVAVNAYLTMLLDTGILHCDPHPGNLLRTLDGKLCILDWGMTLEVPPDLQYGLLEFIAHINTEQFEELPQDFVNLGFSPSEQIDRLASSGITESLAFTFRQLQGGGGAKKLRERLGEQFRDRYGADKSDEEIRALAREEMVTRMEEQLKEEGVDVSGVTNVMEEMSRRNRELFKLPPYVLYVSRAFSTLEGIGLSIDEDYSILQECYPYLARRLMSDNSPRAQKAFRTMIFGGADNSRKDESTSELLASAMGPKKATSTSGSNKKGKKVSGAFSADKAMEMAANFQSYTASTTSIGETEGTREAQRSLASLILSEKENHVQSLLLEGGARAVDSAVRAAYSEARRSLPSQALRTVLKAPKDVLDSVLPSANGPARAFVNLATLPFQAVEAADRLFEQDEDDEAAVEAMQSLLKIASSSPSSPSSPSPAEVARVLTEQLSDPHSILRANASPAVVANLSRRFGGSLLLRAAERLKDTETEHREGAGAGAAPVLLPLGADEITVSVASAASSVASRMAKQVAPELLVDADAEQLVV
jgi:predicted unusual protein kinase regulating ubiquinone biosynthesis (AarF/ABC1/UbiB family)